MKPRLVIASTSPMPVNFNPVEVRRILIRPRATADDRPRRDARFRFNLNHHVKI